MEGFKRSLALAVLMAGCQAPPSGGPVVISPPPSIKSVNVRPPTTAAAALPNAEPTQAVDSRASAAEKMAAQQAKSIQELLDAKAAADAGVPVIEPPKKPSAPAATTPPAPTAPAKTDPPADQFRPVPPIGSANIAAATVAMPADQAAPIPAPSPVGTPEVVRSATVNDAATNDLGRRAREHASDLAAQLDEQLQKFARGDQVPSAEALAGLSSEDRDVLSGLLDGLSNFRSGVQKDNNLLITKKIQPLVSMAERLRGKADLTIANLSLCRSVQGYGKFTPITPLRLVRGVNNKAILYYEVENISPRLDEQNNWATRMRDDIVLYDSNGAVKYTWPADAVTDVCRNRRRDFFFARQLDLPTNLEPGSFTLKVTLSDLNASRVCESSLPLTIVLPGDSAAVNPAGPPLPR